MRLIDADTLKANFINRERNGFQVVYHCAFDEDILALIDNAPTVDVISNEEGYEMYGKGYLQGYERGKSERTQGKWIIDGHHIRCNRCNEYICNTDREGNKIPDNFCSNCGADMRGGAE